ncbi:MAG: replication-associated recombination protein A [Christensenellales bacterium]|jgi:putative ATPase
MDNLFTQNTRSMAPLADRMRPKTLDDFVGQGHIIGRGKLLRRAIEADMLTSSIFYGPPGTGKTTLASIIAQSTSSEFEKLNAVTSGVADVREVIKRAQERIRLYGQSTYLLLDECHRWSKSQSDSILPAIESGTIRFIGSTTENPMISMTPAIVSRCRLFRFEQLTREDIMKNLLRSLSDEENGYGLLKIKADEEALDHICRIADGDARSALNALELAVLTTKPQEDGYIHIDLETAEQSIQHRVLQMDESYFYDMLSAFCKSLRGSDSDAALAWFARMVTAGVDPRIIVRRCIVHSSEDVGLANSHAMTAAINAWRALEAIGMPEARLSIAQAIITICESPKSNAVTVAVNAAFEGAANAKNEPVPSHLRDTHYKGAEKLGSGKGYLYPHDFPGHFVQQSYMPADAQGEIYYQPSDQGGEMNIRKLREIRHQYGHQNDGGKR